MMITENLSNVTAYMIRNDGKVFESGSTHPYLILFDEQYDDVEDWVNKSSNKSALKFLLDHTRYDNVREEVQHLFDQDIDEQRLIEYCKNSYHNLNQEFLRARFGGEYYNSNSSDIYFRISSQFFNWFDIIWHFVYMNRKQISKVTVEHDSNVFSDNRPYKLNGSTLTHIPIDEFLTLPGNPVVESLNESLESNYFLKNLRAGKSIYESAKTLPSHRARVLYESTFTPHVLDYDLRHCLR